MSSLPENRLSLEDRSALLALARSAILSTLAPGPNLPAAPRADLPSFSRRQGVFVTLHVHGKLRGCIGVIEGREPLRDSVVHCAQSAAFRDRRFPPLRYEEISGLQIEISVLSPLAPITPSQIVIGKHGLVVATEGHRGLLLPQVATGHHLSAEEFLRETCHKAGLPANAWKESQTRIYGFTCEIFSEEQSAPSSH